MGNFGIRVFGLRCVSLAIIVLSLSLGPTAAIQPTVEKIAQESDGTVTYYFKIKVDETVHVEGDGKEPNPDFFTIFNFTGMVPGSAKQPPGWTFSTSTNGVTPYRGGRTVLSPIDVEGIPNLTWSRTGAPLQGPAEVSGFSVRTTIKERMVGEYGSQVTRNSPGTLAPGTPSDLKEARIGSITTPKLPTR
jgi:hypothetical protein